MHIEDVHRIRPDGEDDAVGVSLLAVDELADVLGKLVVLSREWAAVWWVLRVSTFLSRPLYHRAARVGDALAVFQRTASRMPCPAVGSMTMR
jgi:hypothetical protein